MNLPIGGMIRDVFGALKKKEINPQTILEEIKSRAKSMATSMGGTVKDGNIGTPTAQEQKDFDTLAASKAKLKSSSFMGTPKQDDSALRAEYLAIQDDPHHPLHTKVRGGYDVDDFGMSFLNLRDLKKDHKCSLLQQHPRQNIYLLLIKKIRTKDYSDSGGTTRNLCCKNESETEK